MRDHNGQSMTVISGPINERGESPQTAFKTVRSMTIFLKADRSGKSRFGDSFDASEQLSTVDPHIHVATSG